MNRVVDAHRVIQRKLPIKGTEIYHCVLHDKKLGITEKFLHTFMRTFPVEWQFNAVDLAKRIGCSRKTIDRALARLMAAGLLERFPSRGEGGVFMGYTYIVFPVVYRLYRQLVKTMEKEDQGAPLDKNI
jgi:predicted transcriptional regulator